MSACIPIRCKGPSDRGYRLHGVAQGQCHPQFSPASCFANTARAHFSSVKPTGLVRRSRPRGCHPSVSEEAVRVVFLNIFKLRAVHMAAPGCELTYTFSDKKAALTSKVSPQPSPRRNDRSTLGLNTVSLPFWQHAHAAIDAILSCQVEFEHTSTVSTL